MPHARVVGSALVILGLGIGALIPVFVVIYPAAGIPPSDAADPNVVLPVVAANPALVTLPGSLEIAVHLVGFVAVLGLAALVGSTPLLVATATAFGIVWLGVDVIGNAITYRLVPELAAAHVAGSGSASTTFVDVQRLVEAIRLGAHVAGGLWVIGVSAVVIRTGALPAIVGWLGVPIGVVFAANLFLPALMTVSFVAVPSWLVVAGAAVARADVTAGTVLLRTPAEA
jgi:hypothetical protein